MTSINHIEFYAIAVRHSVAGIATVSLIFVNVLSSITGSRWAEYNCYRLQRAVKTGPIRRIVEYRSTRWRIKYEVRKYAVGKKIFFPKSLQSPCFDPWTPKYVNRLLIIDGMLFNADAKKLAKPHNASQVICPDR